MTLQEFKVKVARTHDVSFGDVFGQAIELFKKVWLEGLLLIIISLGISMGLSLIVQLISLPMGLAGASIDPNSINDDVPVFFVIAFFLISLLLNYVGAVFSFGLQAAFYRMVRNKDRGVAQEEGVNWGMFLKKEYFSKIALITLYVFLISFAAVLLCVIPIIYAFVPLSLIAPIFAFNPHWTESEIIKGAFALGNRRWLTMFLGLFLGGLLSIFVGLLMLCIGVLFTASFVYLISYQVYKDSVGFTEDQDAIKNIGENS